MRSSAATLARIAAAQRGRITTAQLLGAGIDRHRIKRWVADGRLRREHVGVYALGHPDPSAQGTYLSSVLAAGSGARVSHHACAHLVAIVRSARAPRPELTVPTTAHRRRPGIVIHRVRALHPLDTAMLDGIPITTVPRVLLDIAPTTEPDELARACHEAWVRYRVTPSYVEACIARNPGKPGAAKLRRAVGADVVLSVLEKGFLVLLDAHGLPRPRTNVDRQGDKVDCYWAHRDLTIELVSYRFHGTRHGYETDVTRRRRSRHLAFSYGDVFERGDATAAEIAVLLTD